MNGLSYICQIGGIMSKRRIMVCITQQKSCERLIKKGRNFGQNTSDELFVVHIAKENWRYFSSMQESDALEYLYDTSKNYDASINVIKATDIEEALKTFAIKHKIDTIVMGESLESDEQQNMINRLRSKIANPLHFEIVPIGDEEVEG
jgi:K+-sensing histidine kinase KdpD